MNADRDSDAQMSLSEAWRSARLIVKLVVSLSALAPTLGWVWKKYEDARIEADAKVNALEQALGFDNAESEDGKTPADQKRAKLGKLLGLPEVRYKLGVCEGALKAQSEDYIWRQVYATIKEASAKQGRADEAAQQFRTLTERWPCLPDDKSQAGCAEPVAATARVLERFKGQR